jgi:hypothetical protein
MLFCHRRLGIKVLSNPVEPNEPPQDLTPALGRQDHTTSPYADFFPAKVPARCRAEALAKAGKNSAVILRAWYRSRRAIRPATHRTPDAAASTASHPASVTIAIRPLCPQNLPECANGRFSQNRPSLELSPLRPKGGRACDQSEGQLRWSSSTRIVARASSPNRARKGVDDGTKRSRCRRY